MQLDTTYQLLLRVYGDQSHQAVISNERKSINITVPANNFPYGFLSFPDNGYMVTVGKCFRSWFILNDCVLETNFMSATLMDSLDGGHSGDDYARAFSNWLTEIEAIQNKF